MRTDNDAISGRISIDLNWYMLGQQFADLTDEQQANFLVGMIGVWNDYGTIGMLQQMDQVAEIIDRHQSDKKPMLVKFFNDFADRLK